MRVNLLPRALECAVSISQVPAVLSTKTGSLIALRNQPRLSAKVPVDFSIGNLNLSNCRQLQSVVPLWSAYGQSTVSHGQSDRDARVARSLSSPFYAILTSHRSCAIKTPGHFASCG